MLWCVVFVRVEGGRRSDWGSGGLGDVYGCEFLVLARQFLQFLEFQVLVWLAGCEFLVLGWQFLVLARRFRQFLEFLVLGCLAGLEFFRLSGSFL